MYHLVARVLKSYMSFFGTFGSGLEKHNKHTFYRELSKQSEVVSCFELSVQYFYYLIYRSHYESNYEDTIRSSLLRASVNN